MDIKELKVEIFDLIKQQDNLQLQFRVIEEKKQKLLKELNELEVSKK